MAPSDADTGYHLIKQH